MTAEERRRSDLLVAVDEARRSKDMQSDDLVSLRYRAVALVSAAGAIAALFLGLGGTISSSAVCLWGALAGAVLVALPSAYALWPHTFHMDTDISSIRGWAHDVSGGLTDFPDSLANSHWEDILSNRKALSLLHDAIFAAVCGLVLEILMLSINVVVR